MSHLYALLMNRLSKTQSGIFMSCAIPLLPKDMSSRVYFVIFVASDGRIHVNPRICRYSGKNMLWVLIRSASYAYPQHILNSGMKNIT